jgi:hypothetical protein
MSSLSSSASLLSTYVTLFFPFSLLLTLALLPIVRCPHPHTLTLGWT